MLSRQILVSFHRLLNFAVGLKLEFSCPNLDLTSNFNVAFYSCVLKLRSKADSHDDQTPYLNRDIHG